MKLYDEHNHVIGLIASRKMVDGELHEVIFLDGSGMSFTPGTVAQDRFGDYHIYRRGSRNPDYYYTVFPKEQLKSRDAELFGMSCISIRKVIFNHPATVVYWSDGTKTVVKCSANDKFDPEKGLTMAIAKRFANNSGSYYKEIRKWVGEESCYKANFADAPKEKADLPTDNALLKKYVDKADADLKSFVDAATTGDVAKVMLIFGALNADLELLKTAINK